MTAFNTVLNSVTSTIQSTVISTAVVTVSTVATATSTNFVTSTTTTTIKAAAKRTADFVAPTTVPAIPTAPVEQVPLDSGPPKVYVKTDKRLNILAEKLAQRGLVVERTITSTVYFTAYATATSFYTSVVSSDQTVYVTNVVTNVVTSTTFLNAQTTIQVVSTIVLIVTISGTSTFTGSITSTAQTFGTITASPAGGGGAGHLSGGAKAGIGIGVALGAAAISALIFIIIWWRRSKKHQDTPNQGPGGSNQPVAYVNPTAKFYGPMELATGVAAHHLSQSTTDVDKPELGSPTSTSTNLWNTTEWQQATGYQQPQPSYQGYPASNPAPSYGYGFPSTSPTAHDPRATSPQSFQGGYPQNVAEMQGQNATGQGQYGNHTQRHPQAHEMPAIRPYEGT